MPDAWDQTRTVWVCPHRHLQPGPVHFLLLLAALQLENPVGTASFSLLIRFSVVVEKGSIARHI